MFEISGFLLCSTVLWTEQIPITFLIMHFKFSFLVLMVNRGLSLQFECTGRESALLETNSYKIEMGLHASH